MSDKSANRDRLGRNRCIPHARWGGHRNIQGIQGEAVGPRRGSADSAECSIELGERLKAYCLGHLSDPVLWILQKILGLLDPQPSNVVNEV